MTKLEWCRANAPDSFKGLSDDELLQAMEPMIHSGFVDVPDFDTEEADVSDAYSVLMSKMDKIVLMLVREYGNKLAFKGATCCQSYWAVRHIKRPISTLV